MRFHALKQGLGAAFLLAGHACVTPAAAVPATPAPRRAASAAAVDTEHLADPAGDPYRPSTDFDGATDGPTEADSALLDDATGNGPESAYVLADTLPAAEWQRALTADLDAVEAKGDAYLEAASDGRRAAALAALKVLQTDLARPDIKMFLPLRTAADLAEFRRTTALLAGFAAGNFANFSEDLAVVSSTVAAWIAASR